MSEIPIEDKERLFRAIHPNPEFWKTELNRPSSAAFKDPKGLSVDRDGGRNLETIIDEFKSRYSVKAVVSITAEACRKLGTYPIPRKTDDNPHHAEIHDSPEKIIISRSKARKLSLSVDVDYLED